jgi:CRP/FNR family transcriptional regulator, dissimilatory nitrate respiration regulator
VGRLENDAAAWHGALEPRFQSSSDDHAMSLADELRRIVAGFDSLPETTINRLAAAAVERRYAPRATLYRAGDPANGLYLVLSGRVRVARETQARTELLHVEEAGGVLGEIPVFGGGEFPATATAATPTRCAHLPLDAVERLLREDAAFARFALRRLAVRARGLLRRIDELTATTVTARVAEYVLARAESAGASDFTLGMSQAELAAELGTAREVIVRSLGALVESGALARTGRSRFAVRRPTMLRALAGR